MPRVLPLLAALLVLSACDADGVQIAAGSAITVEAPTAVRGDAEFTARFTNTTGRDLWLGRPEAQLYLQPEPPADFTEAPEPALVYSPVITLDLRPTERIRPGETREVVMFMQRDLLDQTPADGDYRLGLTLYTGPGDQDSLYRDELAPTAVRFSQTFPLTFR